MDMQFERDPFLTVVAMSRDDAAAFPAKELGILKPVVRVDYVKQADPNRYRFGAKVFHVYMQEGK